jgi:hypothetical protein
MAEDSEPNRELGESNFQSCNEPTAPIIDNLRAKTRAGYIVGFILMISPLLLIYEPSVQMSMGILPLLTASLILLMVGVWIFASEGLRQSSLVTAYVILQRLGPPEPQMIRRNVVREYEDIYIFGVSWHGWLYFAAFREQAVLTSVSKLRLPRTLNMWRRNVEVSGIRLIRVEGVFSVPTERGDFVSGEAVLYVTNYFPHEGEWRVPKFTKEQLLAIIGRISEDIKNPDDD